MIRFWIYTSLVSDDRRSREFGFRVFTYHNVYNNLHMTRTQSEPLENTKHVVHVNPPQFALALYTC